MIWHMPLLHVQTPVASLECTRGTCVVLLVLERQDFIFLEGFSLRLPIQEEGHPVLGDHLQTTEKDVLADGQAPIERQGTPLNRHPELLEHVEVLHRGLEVLTEAHPIHEVSP